MRIRKVFLILSIIFLCGFIFSVETLREKPLYIEDTIYSSDVIEEEGGIHIKGTEDDIFSLCGDYLYFYNSTNNGSLYRVNLNIQPFTPILVRGSLGVVYDIDIDDAHDPDGELIFLATAEYNNAIMELNTGTLVYKKIVSSPWIPRKLSVEYFNISGWERIDMTWRTASNVFYWNSNNQVINNIGPDFYGVIDVQYGAPYILYYNSDEIRLYNHLYETTETIFDSGITCAFLDESREYIIYGQDDDYGYNADGRIIQYDYNTDMITYIQSDVDYPSDIWCTANYVYWVERGYWSGSSMIYRYSYYYTLPDTHYYSKVSKIGVNQWIDRVEFQDMQLWSDKLGVYWVDYYGLYIINGADRIPPEKIEWMGTYKTYTFNHWDVLWWNSYDLNSIEDYELIVSETEDFSNYDTYWISESEEYSYTSLEFSDMEYGDYYYKVRTRDTMGTDPQEESNVGEWSDILKISYPAPEGSKQITNILLIIISTISIIGVAIGLGIGGYIIYRRRKQKNIE